MYSRRLLARAATTTLLAASSVTASRSFDGVTAKEERPAKPGASLLFNDRNYAASVWGHFRTSAGATAMSGLTRGADIVGVIAEVRKVPIPDSPRRGISRLRRGLESPAREDVNAKFTLMTRAARLQTSNH